MSDKARLKGEVSLWRRIAEQMRGKNGSAKICHGSGGIVRYGLTVTQARLVAGLHYGGKND